MKRKVLAGLLFGLVGVFFGVSYFLITTSGEDVFQGAGTAPDVLSDMGAAFLHNARLPDMYAWSVINFFDYQYSFGVDTIFRLVDVAMGIGMIYLMTYLALGRKLRLQLKDAVVFALGFLMIFLSPHGRVLYAGFSAIHNYLLIGVISLAFAVPYLKRVRGEETKSGLGVGLGMLVAGVVFGISSNLTPIAFLLTFGTVMVVEMVRTKKIKEVIRKLKLWEVLGVVGIVIGMGVAYVGGPGVSGYFENGYGAEYDYVSVGEMMSASGESVVRIVRHLMNNFGRVLGPAVLVLIVLAGVRVVCGKVRREGKLGWLPAEAEVQRVLVVLGIFVLWHVLIAAQLSAPIRILLPAYLAAVIMTMILAREWTQGWKMEALGVLLLVGVAAVVGVRTVLAWQYHKKAGLVLRKVRESETEVVCVTREEVKSRVLPMIYLGQEDMVADWAMPEKIYDKEIVWCEERM